MRIHIFTVVIAFLFLTISVAVSGQAMSPGPSSAFPPVAMGPGAMGPSSPSDDCTMKVLNVSDCLSYVTIGSNVTVPEKPCCPELAGLVESSPVCLCQLLVKNNSLGLSIDVNRAIKLPSVCRITTPPISLCSVVTGSPVGVPTASEAPGVHPPSGLDASPASGNNGAKTTSNAGSVFTILVGLVFGYLI